METWGSKYSFSRWKAWACNYKWKQLRDKLLQSHTAQRQGAQGDSSFWVIFHWNNWKKSRTMMIHLVLPSTLSFISPNCLLLKNRMTPRKRKMGLKTGTSVLIVLQINDFTNASLFFFTSKIQGWLQPCPSWISMWYLFGKKASQAKVLLSLYWMMAWSGITQTSMPTMWV